MNLRTSGYIAAFMLGAAAFAEPASAQFKGLGGHVGGVGAPHIGAGAAVGTHPSFGGAALGARSGFGTGLAAGNTGAAPLMTGRSVAVPNTGLAAAAAAPTAGFAAQPGFAPNPAIRSAWRGGHRHRFWPYAAAAAGAGIAYGVGSYGYDSPYDSGYYDPGYDAVPVAPAATDIDEGGSCATPVLVCRLYEPAPIGYSCSCAVGGGQARGVVQP